MGVKITGSPAADLVKRQAKAKDEGTRAALTHWWEVELPKHFNPGIEGPLRYAKRGKKYMQRKMREYGHQNPLEFSGRSRRAMLTLKPRTQLDKEGGQLKLTGLPKHFFITMGKGAGGKGITQQPDKVEEALRLTKGMQHQIGKAYKKRYQEIIEDKT